MSLERYLDSFFVDPMSIMWRDGFHTNSTFMPINKFQTKYPVDIYETDDKAVVFEMAAIGIEPEDINITIENGNELLVTYNKESKEADKRMYSGIARRSFRYAWKLDAAKYNFENIAVTLDKGLLQIIVPLAEKAKTRQISITCGCNANALKESCSVETEEHDKSEE